MTRQEAAITIGEEMLAAIERDARVELSEEQLETVVQTTAQFVNEETIPGNQLDKFLGIPENAH